MKFVTNLILLCSLLVGISNSNAVNSSFSCLNSEVKSTKKVAANSNNDFYPLNFANCSGGITIFTASSGTISDGSGINLNYPNNLSCEWLIQPGFPNTVINLSFSRFATELNVDSVTIFDGSSTNDPVLMTLSGNLTNISSIISTGNSMLIKFESNGLLSDKGWSATYNILMAPRCNGLTNLTTTSGTFTDGTINGNNYISNSNCQWLIQPAIGALGIDLSFNYFSTQNNIDIVRVYDGASNTGQLLGTFSGSNIPPLLSAASGSMLVEFISDGTIVSNGFEASYTSTNVPSLVASKDTVFIEAAPGSIADFSVSSNIDWNVTKNASWLITTPTNSSQSQTVYILATQQNTGPSRYESLIIGNSIVGISDTVIVAQNSSGNYLVVSPSAINFIENPIGSELAHVTSSVNWNIIYSSLWLSASQLSGIGNANLQISANHNTSYGIRNGIIVFSGNLGVSNDTIFISQLGRDTTLTTNPDTIEIESNIGSSGTFYVHVDSTIQWISFPLDSWVDLSAKSGTGAQTITVIADSSNISTTLRATKIITRVLGSSIRDTLVVIQKGVAPIFEVSPNRLMLGSDSADYNTFDINSNLRDWTVSENSSWMEVAITRGSFNQNILISATDSNTTSNQRTNTVTISYPPLVPLIVSVTQDTAVAIGVSHLGRLETRVAIYPNPTNGIVTIEFEGNPEVSEFYLYDMLGNKMELTTIYQSNKKIVLDMSNYANGIYFLRIVNKGKAISKKITLIE